jgi:hypothetical protein
MPQTASHILESGPLRIEFEKLRDRWSHKLSFQSGDQWLPIAASIEGSEHEPWPASPPIQELHFETHAGKPVALGVGMSGSSHWSLCVTVDLETNSIQFEVACRTKSRPDRLQSAYETQVPVESSSSQCVLQAPNSIRPIIIRTTDADSQILTASSGSTQTTLTVQPVSSQTLPSPTQRWNYLFTLAKEPLSLV